MLIGQALQAGRHLSAKLRVIVDLLAEVFQPPLPSEAVESEKALWHWIYLR